MCTDWSIYVGPQYARMIDAIECAHPALSLSLEERRSTIADMDTAYAETFTRYGFEAAEMLARENAEFFRNPPASFLTELAEMDSEEE